MNHTIRTHLAVKSAQKIAKGTSVLRAVSPRATGNGMLPTVLRAQTFSKVHFAWQAHRFRGRRSILCPRKVKYRFRGRAREKEKEKEKENETHKFRKKEELTRKKDRKRKTKRKKEIIDHEKEGKKES